MEKPPMEEEAVCRWIIDAVARYARVSAATLNAGTAFEDTGLSSLAAVMLSGELSDALGVDIDPMITWDHRTIGEAARAICERFGSTSAGLGETRRG
jgi:acyl carrier protein